MNRIVPSLRWLCIVALCLCAVPGARAQQQKNPQLVKLFRDAIAKSKESTVRVLAGGKEASLGIVVSADGWILTKHSVLKGKITVKLPGETEETDAELYGYDDAFDLAMLKVDAEDLKPIAWTDSKASKIGHWVASAGTGEDAIALGVISVAAREVKGAKFTPPSGTQGGYLGIALDLDFAGVKVQEVFDNTPAKKAGLKTDDQIVALNGTAIQSTDDFLALLAKNKIGDEVKLKITRAEKEQDLRITLGARPGTKGGKSRSDQQNSMGSKLSERRAGFPIILQHDSVLKPTDCGGPLVNLEGQVVGVNICRAGRVESYAIPSEAVRPLLEKLKMKKLTEEKK
jgi:serine protease Do